MKDFYHTKLRPALLTLLSLGVGYLTICICTSMLYTVWSGTGHMLSSKFLAFAAICGLVFATLSGYLAAFAARRAPVLHAAGFALMLTGVWAFSLVMYGSIESLLTMVLNIAIAISGSMIGGWLRYWQINRASADEPRAGELIESEA
ncbi:MAG: hypothetical protein AAGM27_07875 [Cyanobacteria bacterium J06554_3]